MRSEARVSFWPVLAAGVAVGALSYVAYPMPIGLPAEAWVLLPLAMVAELLSVPLGRGGIRLSFPLPFLAGIAIVAGPFAALAADLALTAAGFGMICFAQRRVIAPRWLGYNSGIAALSCGAAGIVTTLIALPALQAIAFCAVYALINAVFVSRSSEFPLSKHSVVNTVREAYGPLTVYVALTVAVAVLAAEQQWWWCVPALLPVLALRGCMYLKLRMMEQYYETVSALTMMLQRAHPYTHGHLERVACLAEEVALRLGMQPKHARMVREASVLHDIGKIAIDEVILDKPAKLTDTEMEHVRKHAAFGAAIVAAVEPFHAMVPWIRHHHERPDGQGYPAGLRDIEIPVESKIIAVVDAYDAMAGGKAPSERRPYREPMAPAAALAELERCAGTQFDPTVVKAFRAVVEAAV